MILQRETTKAFGNSPEAELYSMLAILTMRLVPIWETTHATGRAGDLAACRVSDAMVLDTRQSARIPLRTEWGHPVCATATLHGIRKQARNAFG